MVCVPISAHSLLALLLPPAERIRASLGLAAPHGDQPPDDLVAQALLFTGAQRVAADSLRVLRHGNRSSRSWARRDSGSVSRIPSSLAHDL